MNFEAETPVVPSPLRCLLFVDKETSRWVAHCLDFDLATSGKDEDAAWDNLKSVVRLHVEHCFTHHHEAFNKKASEAEFARFEALKKVQPEFRSEKISFRLVPPKTQFSAPLWMHGFEGSASLESFGAGSLQPIH
jgi:predicted RNase H-like HicB family nuclease